MNSSRGMIEADEVGIGMRSDRSVQGGHMRAIHRAHDFDICHGAMFKNEPLRSIRFVVFCLFGILSLFQAQRAIAQTIVPFTSNVERLMVFGDKRFKEVDARPPRRSWPMDRALLYQDTDGKLVHYSLDAGHSSILESTEPDTIQVEGERAAWLLGDTLKTLRAGSAFVVATGVARFKVSDSLIVYHDSLEQELLVFWNGQRKPLAKLEQGTYGPQWNQGGNTVTIFNRSTRTLSLFQGGRLVELADSTDVGIVSNGTGVVAYWDDVRDEFMGAFNGTTMRLSGLRPVSSQAGNGILAFVDGTLKLKCWRGGELLTLTDTMPTKYWVKDNVLLYLDGGRLKMLDTTIDRVITVEDIVPEQWQVEGDLLVYLDENRELRGIQKGERIRFGKEAAIDGFDLFGEAVLYRSPSGPITVIRSGKSYLY